MGRTLAALAAVAVVALAGCGGLGGVTTTTEPTTTGTGAFDYPPGTSAGGIDDLEALLAAHEAVLAGTSYDVSALQRDEREGRPGATEQRVNVRSDPAAARAHAVSEGTGSLSGAEVFVNATTVFVKRTSRGTTSYDVRPAPVSFAEQHRRQQGLGFVRAVATAGTWAPAAVVEREGRPAVVYELVDHAPPEPDVEVTDASGTLIVDTRGVVYDATLRVEGRQEGEAFVADVEYHVLRLGGVAVAVPAWVAEARERTDG